MISKCEDVADRAVATAPQETGSEDQAREAEEKAARQAGRRLTAGPQGQRGESTRRGRSELTSGRRGDATDHYGDANDQYGYGYVGEYETQAEVEGQEVTQARSSTRQKDRGQQAREGMLEEEEDQRLAQERGDVEGDGEYTEDTLVAAAVAGSGARMVPFNVQVQRVDAVLSRWDRSKPEADRWMQGGPQQRQAALQANDPTLPSFSWFSPLLSPSPLGQSEPSPAAKPRWRHPLLGYWFVRRDLSGSRPPKSVVRPEVRRTHASRALAVQHKGQDGPASAPRTCILPISAPRWLALALTCRKPISVRVCC